MSRLKKLTSVMLAILLAVMTLAPAAGAVMLPENPALAREILGEGMVLLKNEGNVLPFKNTDTIAVFGQGQLYLASTSQGYQIGGGGSGNLTPAYTPVGPLDALEAAASAGKIKLYQPLVAAYRANSAYVPTDAMYADAAAGSDKALVFIPRFSTEGSDRGTGKGDWLLSDAETAMLQKLSASFDQVVVAVNSGGVVDTSWAVGEVDGIDIEGLLMVWQGGAEGGNGIADILLGDVNPSGKLVDTFAKDINDYPSTDGFFNSAYVDYNEDVFVGYRYFETFDPNYTRVNYEFGFGLSYTKFEFSNITYSADGGNINVALDVKNTGTVAGKEVVQVYFSAPQMHTGSAVLGKPGKELAAFDKTDLIAPGATQRMTLSFPITDMSSYDDLGVTGNKSAYVMEAGDYKIFVGNSVKDAGTRQAGVYSLDELVVTEQLTKKVAPNRLSSRLVADGTQEYLTENRPTATIAATGSTKVEAETYTNSSPEARIESFDNGNGQCIAYLNRANGFVEYTLIVEEAGLYDMMLHMANGNAILKDFAVVSISGTKQMNVNLDCPQTGLGSANGEWYNFIDLAPVVLDLPKGVITLRVGAKDASFGNLDYLTFRPHTGVSISPSLPTTVQAEYYLDSTKTGVIVTKEYFTTAQGKLLQNDEWIPYEGGTLAYMHQAGNFASYYLEVEEAGVYELAFRMSNGRAQVSNMMGVFVNNVNQDLNVTCPQTGDGSGKSEWYNFRDIDPYEVYLPEGRVELKLVSNVTNFPNIDSMTFTKKQVIGSSPVTKIDASTYLGFTGTVRRENYNIPSLGLSGTCVAYLDKANASITYTLNVATAGEYDLSFAMANGYDAKALKTDIIINNDSANKQTFSFTCPRTGQEGAIDRWYNFQEMPVGTVTLPAGVISFTIRPDLTAYPSGGGFANLGQIIFRMPEADRSVSLPVMFAQGDVEVQRAEGETITLMDVYNGTATLEELVAQMSITELASFTTGYAAGVGQGTGSIGGNDTVNTKYGIPRADTADGPGGLRLNSKSTGWGCEMLTGCTWNLDLVYRFGAAVGKEAIASGVDIWLAPGMNIHRNPMCGRNFEYYSEDPLLTGEMAAAVTLGVQDQGVAITLKHFAANNKEGNRNSSDSRISERALREIYLKGFEIAVKKADPWCIMSSYNYINGIETSENPELLNDIARSEWGFGGFFMTDWGNNSNIVKEVLAGNNVKMSTGDPAQIVTAYNNGTISRELLELNAIQMIAVLMKLPDFLSPLNPKVLDISATEPTKVEAEDYTTKHAGVQIEYGTVINAGYMDRTDENGNPASFLTYTLNVARAGSYEVLFRLANNNSGTDVLEFYVNGELQNVTLDNPSTGGWQVYTDRGPVTVDLPAGEVTVTIKAKNTRFGNIDYMIFERVGGEPEAQVIAPAEVIKNELFEITILTPFTPGKLTLLNHESRFVANSIVSQTEEDGITTTVLRLCLGTPAVDRTMRVLSDGEVIGDFTLTVTNIPDGIVSLAAPETVVAKENFEVTITTTKNLIKGKFYNEYGNVIGSVVTSKVVTGDYRVAVYSLNIGTAGARTITFRADYDKHAEFPFSTDFDITVLPVMPV